MTKRERETAEYAAMMRRMLASWIRRVADGDPDDLAELLAATVLLDDGIQSAVTSMRLHYGLSWSEIGAAAGTTRQAAQQRWGTAPTKAAAPEPSECFDCPPDCTVDHGYRADTETTKLALQAELKAKLQNMADPGYEL